MIWNGTCDFSPLKSATSTIRLPKWNGRAGWMAWWLGWESQSRRERREEILAGPISIERREDAIRGA